MRPIPIVTKSVPIRKEGQMNRLDDCYSTDLCVVKYGGLPTLSNVQRGQIVPLSPDVNCFAQ